LDHQTTLFYIALILLLGKIAGLPFRKLSLNPIAAYILIGFLLGSGVFGVISIKPSILELSGLTYLCLILIMLYTGLTTEFEDLLKYLKPIIAIATLGVLTTLSLIYFSLTLMGFNTIVALFVSISLSNTATETVAAFISRKGDSLTRSLAIGASFVDDVIAVYLITLLTSIGFHEIMLMEFVVFSLKTLTFLSIFFYITSLLSNRYTGFYQYLASNYSSFTTIAILLSLLLAVLARLIGLSELIGAYLAGILISRGREHHDPMLRTRVALFNFISDFAIILDALFIPLFFTIVGLSYSINMVDPYLYTLLLTLAIIGKVAGAAIPSYIYLKDTWRSIAIGIAMTSRGSLEIVLIKLGLDNGLIDNVMFNTILSVSLTTSILAPVLYSLIMGKAQIGPSTHPR